MKPKAVEQYLRKLSPVGPSTTLDERIQIALQQATEAPGDSPMSPLLEEKVRLRGNLARTTTRSWKPAATAAALAFVAVAAYAIAVLPNAAPEIQFDIERIDLGMLPENTVASRTVGVSNQGGKTLQIQAVKTTCGCTVATFDNLLVKPGHATNMVVTVDPAKVKHPYGTKQLVVFSNDPQRPEAQLEVTAESAKPQPKLGYIH